MKLRNFGETWRVVLDDDVGQPCQSQPLHRGMTQQPQAVGLEAAGRT